jgi:hypothetical protein
MQKRVEELEYICISNNSTVQSSFEYAKVAQRRISFRTG